MADVSKSINAANQFTDPIAFAAGAVFDVSVSGVFVGTVTLQRSFDGGLTWVDVQTYQAPYEDQGTGTNATLYRIGFKPGQYTSGTANVLLRGATCRR